MTRRPPRRTARPRRRLRGAAGVLAVAVLAVAAACSGGEDGGSGADRPDREATVDEVLGALADGVIIPSYEALVANAGALEDSLTALCDDPGTEAGLAGARDRWRDTELAWQSTRAAGVGPAVDQRAMSAIAFRSDPAKVAALIAGEAPLDPAALAGVGADQRGLHGVEVALFGEGSEELATPGTPTRDRRCRYLASSTGLVADAAQGVLDAWTADGGHRGAFVRGMDGDPTGSVEAIVSELSFRLQQVDDQGLRAMAAARTYDDLPLTRQEGAAAHGVASLRGILGGVAAVVLGPDGEPGLADLVAARSADTADRLEELTGGALRALRELPASIAEAMEDRAAVQDAADAVAALRVLVTTEVASRLGVTIGFGDADGDS